MSERIEGYVFGEPFSLRPGGKTTVRTPVGPVEVEHLPHTQQMRVRWKTDELTTEQLTAIQKGSVAIPLALTPEEWAYRAKGGTDPWFADDFDRTDSPNLCARAIAIANAALPDSDRRKITREKVRAVREAADEIESRLRNPHYGMADQRSLAAFQMDHLRALADALESYLPPGGNT